MPRPHLSNRVAWSRRLLGAAALPLLAGCTGVQSSLEPAGSEADLVAGLFWVMVAGGTAIWLLVLGLALFAARAEPRSDTAGRWLIRGGGVALPVVVLTTLLIYGLAAMPPLRAESGGGVRVAVAGEQFWWRVTYVGEDGEPLFETANEVVLPVGVRTEFRITSPDVIHSFWLPSVAGKIDAIPGRETRIVLEPTRTGGFRGQCAELCGASHAYMAFTAEIVTPEAFADWLDERASEAQEPQSALEQQGLAVFTANGCGACHTIRGTPAAGSAGPDLTHVGSRPTIAAGSFPTSVGSIAGWVAHAPDLKPQAAMPAFDTLGATELRAVAAYLASLQ